MRLPYKLGTMDDTDLVALCRRAEAIESTHDEHGDGCACAALLDDIHKQIIATAARTLEGLIAKARRVLWCRGGELHLDMDAADDMRHAMAIVRDLLALAP